MLSESEAWHGVPVTFLQRHPCILQSIRAKEIDQKMAEHSTVVGVFADEQQAEQTMRALQQAGYGNDRIGFLVRHSGGVLGGIVGGVMGAADAVLMPVLGPTEANAALESALPLSEEALETFQLRHGPKPAEEQPSALPSDEMRGVARTETPESAARTANVAGEESGVAPTEVRTGEGEGIVSGGIVGGLLGAAVALLIPGIGPAVAGGILAATLGGAAIGAVTGGILGVFAHMGIPEHEAHLYRRELEAGRVLVTVQADGEQAQQVMDILHRNGAVMVR